ncbi:TonB-dependent siderophore receptor [Oecophyllibacter saccharovorans]|nr:TonB-dependent siderophore receptor [Oecophyllibacter saccharovorans]
MKPGMFNACGGNSQGGRGRGVFALLHARSRPRGGPRNRAEARACREPDPGPLYHSENLKPFSPTLGNWTTLGLLLWAGQMPVPAMAAPVTAPVAAGKGVAPRSGVAAAAKASAGTMPAGKPTEHQPLKHQPVEHLPVEHLVVRAQTIPAPGAAADYMAKDVDLGPLGTKPILDTPFSVDEVRRDVLLNQQIRNINDTAKYNPSVQLEERGDPNISRPQSRGFEGDVISNSRMDGLNILTTTPYAAEQFDHLTVLNGLSGALYGPQNPAGMFNYVLKRPTDTPTLMLNVGVDSNGAPVESLDAGGRIGWFGGRLNLLNQTGESYVGGSHIRRNMVSGDVDIHLDEKTTLYLDGSQYSTAFRGLPGEFVYSTGIDLPQAPDLSRRGYGQRQGGYNTSTSTGLARLEHAFNEAWKLRLGGLYQNAARDVFTINNTLTDNRGDYTQSIAAPATAKVFKDWSNFAYLDGRVRTGFVVHHLNLGSTGYSLGNYNPRVGQTFTIDQANIRAPKVVDGPQPHSHGTYQSAFTRVQTLMVGDTLDIGRQVSVMGELSWAWLKTKNWNKAGISNPKGNFSDNGYFAPVVTLNYKPVQNATFYFNWGKSIQPGLLSPTNKYNQGGVQPPLQSEQYEVGAKWQPCDSLLLTADGFRMTRPYSFTDPVTHVFGEGGMQRNYGVEFMASGHLTPDLAIMGGVTWLDAQVGKTASPATSHKQVVGVPPVMANILLDYTLPLAKTVFRGTALTANVHYTGRRAADVTNRTFAGSYVTLDLGIRYATRIYGQSAAFRFGVNNVTNERYWASVFPNSINGAEGNDTAMAGLPRTYQFTMTLGLNFL